MVWDFALGLETSVFGITRAGVGVTRTLLVRENLRLPWKEKLAKAIKEVQNTAPFQDT